MAIKLGELLVKEGLITQDQLEEALRNQVIFGGRLGTNLIEMGAVDEEAIARVLSRKVGAPYVAPGELTEIPEEVIAAIPTEIVEKYRVVPLTLDKRRLTLVMADPTDLKAIDEIAFRTGFIVRPVVAADVRLNWAMEKYYGVVSKARYVPTGRQAAPRPRPPEAPRSPQPAPPAGEQEIEELEEIEELLEETEEPTGRELGFPAGGDFTSFEDLPEAEAEPTASSAPAPAPAPSAAAPRPSPPAPPAPAEPLTEDAVALRLTEARDREDIADVLATYLGREFPRAALFMVRGDAVQGWRGISGGETRAGFDQFQVPLDEPSLLQTVVSSRSYYLGPLARTPFNSMLLQELGGGVPQVALCLPILMMNRVVGLIYLDDPGGDLGARVPLLQKLAGKAAMAFDILILKNKILAT